MQVNLTTPQFGDTRLPPRFWAKVRVLDNGCWEWTGGQFPNGYGAFHITHKGTVYAHRWSYEHLVAPIPNGLQSDHLCRNRPCVNPAHIEPVTCAENLRRGLNHKGEANGRAKLSWEHIAIIRASKGQRQGHRLAAVFDVTASTISKALRGDTWK